MPHQCLKCGKIFEDGSSQLLRGCPECSGNRFFFTKQALDENQRDIISEKVNQDITTKIIDSLSKDNTYKSALQNNDKWLSIKPKEIRKIIEGRIQTDEPVPQKEQKDPKPITLIDDEFRKTTIKKIQSESDTHNSPETIDIEKPGKYNINLKGLLEKEPIIIQKDGSYIIHLPSLFKMNNKEE
jgi:uncharacterized protein